jgi:phenylalanyl-tRNA synthetase beta chain
MKFTLSWLKTHLFTDASATIIAEKLTSLGLELESLDDPSARLKGFVVGHVIEAGKHPNADRLKLCKVDAGNGKILQVVCGAPNAREGLKVVLAQPGTVIPLTGEALKAGKVRDVESQAMMCSWRELKMGEDHDGIIELPAETPVGIPLADAIAHEPRSQVSLGVSASERVASGGLAARLDPLFDISVTPNRADALGVRGVARDLAAIGVGTLEKLIVDPVPGTFDSPSKVILEESGCPLFGGRWIRGVKNGESPEWLKARLTSIGLKPISALVDITNFFTFDLNRPLHVFDAGKISGDLTVRLAREGETLLALNGKTLSLSPQMTVIADANGVQSIGGVMGGEHTGVSETTTDVFLEAALFEPAKVATTGRVLGLDSDARYRFERGVDPAFVLPALDLATRMIIEICGGEASHPLVAGSIPAAKPSVAFRPARVKQLGGVDPEPEAMRQMLTAIGCGVSGEGDVWDVSLPSWRVDLSAEHDLVEEVLRLHGYDNIPVVGLDRPAVPRPVLTSTQRRITWLRRALASRGLNETVTWSFLSQDKAKLFGGGQTELVLANPIASDLDTMRPSVLPNLLSAVARNADRGFKDVALFEIGAQFKGDRPEDQQTIAAGLRSGQTALRHWSGTPRTWDALDAKADALAAIGAAQGPTDSLQVFAEAPAWYHPGRSGSLKLGNKTVAWFGEIHPRILAAFDIKEAVVGFEIVLDMLPPLKVKAGKGKAGFRPPALQSVERDFAFVVDATVPADQVLRAAKNADKALITGVSLFDVYEGQHMEQGKKSLAIQVTLQPTDKTLTDVEIEAVAAKVVEAVVKATGGALRG